MTAWDTPGANPLEDLRRAVAGIEEYVYVEEPYVVHPAQHAKACQLLGRPEGSPLTNRDLEEAAALELEQLTPEQRAEVLDQLARMTGWAP